MKLTVERAALLKSLGHVHRVVERRNTIPILANVLIRADKSTLSLKATDLDLEVIESLAAETGATGAATVPAHMFYDIVRKLPEGSEIELLRDGEQGRLTITAGPAQFSLQTLPADDFPALSVDDLGHSFRIGLDAFGQLVDGPGAELNDQLDKTGVFEVGDDL